MTYQLSVIIEYTNDYSTGTTATLLLDVLDCRSESMPAATQQVNSVYIDISNVSINSHPQVDLSYWGITDLTAVQCAPYSVGFEYYNEQTALWEYITQASLP